MEKPKRKNNDAPSRTTIQNLIWLFLVMSYVTLICSKSSGDADFRGKYSCTPIWNYPYLLIDHIFVNVALMALWYMADDWFRNARIRQLVRGLIIVYLFAGRLLLSNLMVVYAC